MGSAEQAGPAQNMLSHSFPFTRKYEFPDKRVLGAGKSTTTVEGVKQGTEEAFVIKVLSKRVASSSEQMSFKKYFSTLKQLQGEFFPSWFQFFDYADTLAMVIPKFMSGNLLTVARSIRKYSELHASHLIYLLLKAVRIMHRKQILHNNIHPGNILFQSGEEGLGLVLTDMISAEEALSNQELFAVLFRAPECFTNKVDERSDVWSCGVILYMLLNGRLPFTGFNLQDLTAKIKTGKLAPFNESVSAQAMNLCERMLVDSPANRLSLEDCLKHSWFVEVKTSKKQLPEVPIGLTQYYYSKLMVWTLTNYVRSSGVIERETDRIREVFEKKKVGRGEKVAQDTLISDYMSASKMHREVARRICKSILLKVTPNPKVAVYHSKFTTILKQENPNTLEKSINAVSQLIDQNKSGEIDRQELFGISRQTCLSSEDIDAIMGMVDTGRDGSISLQEWRRFITRVLNPDL